MNLVVPLELEPGRSCSLARIRGVGWGGREMKWHLEELVDAAGGDPRSALVSIDGVRLPAARLPVRKDADVVAVHRRLDQVLGVLKHLLTSLAKKGVCTRVGWGWVGWGGITTPF